MFVSSNAFLGYVRLSSLKPQEDYRMSLLLPVQIQGVHIFGISVTKLKLEVVQFDLIELDKSTIRKI